MSRHLERTENVVPSSLSSYTFGRRRHLVWFFHQIHGLPINGSMLLTLKSCHESLASLDDFIRCIDRRNNVIESALLEYSSRFMYLTNAYSGSTNRKFRRDCGSPHCHTFMDGPNKQLTLCRFAGNKWTSSVE